MKANNLRHQPREKQTLFERFLQIINMDETEKLNEDACSLSNENRGITA